MDEKTKEEAGLRTWFWAIANRVAGKDARRKTGFITAILGTLATILAYTIQGKVGLVLLITGCVAIVTGLMMRLFPDMPELKAKEETAPKDTSVKVTVVPDAEEEFKSGVAKTGDDVLAEVAQSLGIHDKKWSKLAKKIRAGNPTVDEKLLYNAVVSVAEERELVEVS